MLSQLKDAAMQAVHASLFAMSIYWGHAQVCKELVRTHTRRALSLEIISLLNIEKIAQGCRFLVGRQEPFQRCTRETSVFFLADDVIVTW